MSFYGIIVPKLFPLVFIITNDMLSFESYLAYMLFSPNVTVHILATFYSPRQLRSSYFVQVHSPKTGIFPLKIWMSLPHIYL